MELLLHFFVERLTILFDRLKPIINGLFPYFSHRLQHLNFLLHPSFLFILSLFLLSAGLLDGLMIGLVLLIEDVLSLLLQLAFPFPVLLV